MSKKGVVMKVLKRAGTDTAKAVGDAAKKTIKQAPEIITRNDDGSIVKWLTRVVTNIPKYIRLYIGLLADDRVDHKIKALLVTAVMVLGTFFAVDGIFFHIQAFSALIFGPFAFLPSILIMLITLDICYTMMDQGTIEEHVEKTLGDKNSVRADIDYLKGWLGSRYDRIRNLWTKRSEKAQKKMEEEGLIKDGEVAEEVLDETVENLVELETSEKLKKKVKSTAKQLEAGKINPAKLLESLSGKLLDDGTDS